MTIFEAQRRINKLDITALVEDIIQEDEAVIVELNQNQLLAGKNSDGTPVRPVYASDAYAQFKQQITPNSERGTYTPNLYVTGQFYSTFFVLTNNNRIIYGSDNDVNNLESKYTSKIFGLTRESKEFYVNNFLRRKLMETIKNLLLL